MRMRFEIWKKSVAVVTAAALLVTGVTVSGQSAQARKKTKLSKKKLTLVVGQKKKLKLKNARGKVTWKSSRKKIATVTKKGVVKGKKQGKAKITARCGKKRYVCKVTVKRRTETPSASAVPGKSPAPGSTAVPSASPSARPGQTSGPAASATTVSGHTKPTTAAAKTLAVGTYAVTLGMTKAQVESTMGAGPDKTGTSVLGYDVYIYNPSMDYTNYLEMQFQNDQLVEMSTISGYFCYAGLASSGETAETLTGRGFQSMSNYGYEAGYRYQDTDAYVNAYVDHQGSGGVYAVQIFARSLASSQEKLILPKYCTYNASVVSCMQSELPDYVNAFRVFKGGTPMTVSTVTAAQTHAEEMAAAGKTQQSSADGTTWKERFDSSYGEYYAATEFVADSCPDAFSFAVYAADKSSTSGVSTTYKYLSGQQTDTEGNVLDDFYISCGFAYNTSSSLYTFCAIDIFNF